MSMRGLGFVREWVAQNVDLSSTYPYPEKRARALASACERDARTQSIGLQEIEDETGDLEEAMTRILETRNPIL